MAEEERIPLNEVDVRCKSCGWTGKGTELRRTTYSEIEIGGTETDAKVVSQKQGVIVHCPGCGALRDFTFTLPEGLLPVGKYFIDLREGLE